MDHFTPLVATHAAAASYALVAGLVQVLRRRRGDGGHRVLGWSWTVAIAIVVGTSFGIQDLNGGFSWLHALSVLTASTTAIAIAAARRHNARSHRTGMIGTYLGLVGAFVGVVAVPSRSIPTFAGGQPVEFALWAASVLTVALALALSLLHLSRPEHVRGR